MCVTSSLPLMLRGNRLSVVLGWLLWNRLHPEHTCHTDAKTNGEGGTQSKEREGCEEKKLGRSIHGKSTATRVNFPVAMKTRTLIYVNHNILTPS